MSKKIIIILFTVLMVLSVIAAQALTPEIFVKRYNGYNDLVAKNAFENISLQDFVQVKDYPDKFELSLEDEFITLGYNLKKDGHIESCYLSSLTTAPGAENHLAFIGLMRDYASFLMVVLTQKMTWKEAGYFFDYLIKGSLIDKPHDNEFTIDGITFYYNFGKIEIDNTKYGTARTYFFLCFP